MADFREQAEKCADKIACGGAPDESFRGVLVEELSAALALAHRAGVSRAVGVIKDLGELWNDPGTAEVYASALEFETRHRQ